MKRLIFCLSILLNLVLASIVLYYCYAEKNRKEYFDFSRYVNLQNSDSIQTFFIGNSITANWINLRPEFFSNNRFANRGVGGQTSSQILLRFQQDVISQNARLVVLTTGSNDIAEADGGVYQQSITLSNIQSIVDICKVNNIKLILTSVLPVLEIKVNRFKKIDNPNEKIDLLNLEIEKLANRNNLKYVDYNSKLRNIDGTFTKIYTFDGVHPNEKGYEIMEFLIMQTIQEIEN